MAGSYRSNEILWRWCPVILMCTALALYGQVLINEIMFNPDGSEHSDEFVEIVNSSSSLSVDLSGWSVHDGEAGDIIIEAGEGVILAPDQIGLILDADYFEKSDQYQALIPEDALVMTVDGSTIGSGGLSNSQPECIRLVNAAQQLMDSIRYDIDIKHGHSYERISLDKPSCDVTNWKESVKLHGSPGFRNSVSPWRVDLAVPEISSCLNDESQSDQMCINITVHNSGLNPVDDARIVLFEDDNGDSLCSDQEIVKTQDIGLISSGDSTVIRFEWFDFKYGSLCLGTEILLPTDENADNNRMFSEIWISYPKGALIINEIMADPLNDSPEWIEVYHPQDYPIDLLGWSISDENTDKQYLISETSICIAPHSYAIFSENQDLPVSTTDALLITVHPFPNLNNRYGGVFLTDPALSVMDSVNYNQTWGGGDGVSLERIRYDGESGDSTNWHACTFLEGMTPGKKNSVSIQTGIRQAMLQIDPNPFSPDGDGIDEVTLIQYKLPFDYATITCSLYDIHGRRICDLRRGTESSGEGVMLWDGQDNSGCPARIGIYIVYLEAIDYASGTVIHEKNTIVLAGAL